MSASLLSDRDPAASAAWIKRIASGALLSAALLTSQAAAQSSGPTRLIAWNDLGMHCMDPDFSVFSILPPFNNLNAQLMVAGKLVATTNTYRVTYEAVADPSGSINKTSIGKTNFWQWALPLFGLNLAPDVGLTGNAMPGPTNQPQPTAYETIWKWFHVDGIPLTPFDDAGAYKPYGQMRLVARNQAGQLLASTVASTPVSQEMLCTQCHASGSSPLARPVSGWVYSPDPVKDDRLNILKLHDQKHLGTAKFDAALASLGINPAGLLASVTNDQRPILCDACHASNALPGTGLPGIKPLTEVMHTKHGSVPEEHGTILDDIKTRSSCYTCHPGNKTQCLRDAMGKAIGSDGQFSMHCQSCHGSQADVGKPGRVGWLEQPNCQQCHTGTATQNSGAIRFTSVFDQNGNPHVPANLTFATQPDVPAPGFSLFRYSAGHGSLQCSACHGSPHAIWPTSEANDNLQATLLQGHAGTLTDCSTCHTGLEDNQIQGPHGMHPPTAAWAAGKHGDFAKGAGLANCQACHGAASRGTVLSVAQGPRSFGTAFGTKNFFEGQRIGCYDCHNGPTSENPTSNHAPFVPNVQQSTPNDTPLAITLTGSDSDGNPLTYRIISQPSHGTAGIVGQVATYYPNAAYPNQHYIGPDSFTYTANDSKVDSNLGTIQVSVGVPACAGSTETYGFPTPGSGGFFPRLEFSGCPSPGKSVALNVTKGLGGSFGFLVMGQQQSQVELLPGLTLRVTPIELLSAAIPLSAGGPGQGSFSLPAQLSPSLTPFVRTFQVFILDPGTANGLSATNGLEVHLQ